MKRRSFRLKLVLLSVGLSGLVLGAFAVSGWALIYRFSLERLDREIRDWGRRDLEMPQPPDRWSQIAEAMRFALGGDTAGRRRFILLVRDRDGDIRYVSPDWPAEIPVTAFPAPVGPATPEPPAGDWSAHGGPTAEPVPPPIDGNHGPRGPDADWVADAPGPPPPPHDGGPGHGGPRSPPFGPWDGPWGVHGHEGGPGHGLFPVRLSGDGFRTWPAGAEHWRVGVMHSPDVTLAMGVNLDEFTAGMRRVRNAFLLALPAALFLIAAGSWFLAQRALRPIEELTRAVERVTAKGLDQRVPDREADAEFGRLIAVFNEMLGRLERSFGQAARFSADAAHELKTPLTVLQGRLEQALQHAAPGSEEQRVYGELADEVLRLKTIVQRLLLLARADSGQLKPQLGEVALTLLVQDMAEDVGIMAPHLQVKTDLTANLTVLADADLLRQALHNLADNAAKYNREAGWVEFTLRQTGTEAVLTLANSAPDIPTADHERIFERFYRADPAHSRRIDGTGLGLSLAREIARAHGGDVVLTESRGGVTRFALRLPLAPTPTPAAPAAADGKGSP